MVSFIMLLDDGVYELMQYWLILITQHALPMLWARVVNIWFGAKFLPCLQMDMCFSEHDGFIYFSFAHLNFTHLICWQVKTGLLFIDRRP